MRDSWPVSCAKESRDRNGPNRGCTWISGVRASRRPPLGGAIARNWRPNSPTLSSTIRSRRRNWSRRLPRLLQTDGGRRTRLRQAIRFLTGSGCAADRRRYSVTSMTSLTRLPQSAGHSAVVILASGLEPRLPLPWAAGFGIFEIDSHSSSSQIRCPHDLGATPPADRRTGAIDLRNDWPQPCETGFDRHSRRHDR